MSEPHSIYWTCCKELARNLNHRDSVGKGITPCVVVEFMGKPFDRAVLMGFTYRHKAQSQGCLLNFCPWCGAGLRLWDDFEKPVSVGKTEPPPHTD